MKKVTITQEQKEALEKLIPVYSRGGEKCTKTNYRYISDILEKGEDRKEEHMDIMIGMVESGFEAEIIKKLSISQECITEVENIVYGNKS